MRSGSAASVLDRAAAKLEQACNAKNAEQAVELLHPAVKAGYGATLRARKDELPRLGRLLATRKLIAATDEVAEYEVTEDGKTFILTFERHGDQWLLVGM